MNKKISLYIHDHRLPVRSAYFKGFFTDIFGWNLLPSLKYDSFWGYYWGSQSDYPSGSPLNGLTYLGWLHVQKVSFHTTFNRRWLQSTRYQPWWKFWHHTLGILLEADSKRCLLWVKWGLYENLRLILPCWFQSRRSWWFLDERVCWQAWGHNGWRYTFDRAGTWLQRWLVL